VFDKKQLKGKSQQPASHEPRAGVGRRNIDHLLANSRDPEAGSSELTELERQLSLEGDQTEMLSAATGSAERRNIITIVVLPVVVVVPLSTQSDFEPTRACAG
jgi:hypothetical protein